MTLLRGEQADQASVLTSPNYNYVLQDPVWRWVPLRTKGSNPWLLSLGYKDSAGPVININWALLLNIGYFSYFIVKTTPFMVHFPIIHD